MLLCWGCVCLPSNVLQDIQNHLPRVSHSHVASKLFGSKHTVEQTSAPLACCFHPQVDISTRVVAFPACRPGEEACQTLVLSNYGDTPASFAFQNAKALGPEFAVKPAHGVLAARSHALVGLRFRPSSNQHYSAKAVIIFNGATMYPTEIELNGSGSQPQLMFDLGAGAGMGAATRSGTSNTLFFRPTCVGASSQRTLTVLNPSRVSVMFKWQMPSKLEGVVAVAPVSGLLRGNESTQVTWSFAPTKQKTYDAR